MFAQAAHLVDAVVPAVPLRHYVLSFPFELSLLAATNAEVLRAVARINYEVTAKFIRSRAAASGVVGKTHAGALTFVHRFGSSLNLHVHLHVCVFDGVYVERANEAPYFSPARPLTKDDLGELVERVAERVVTWLRKHGFVKDEPDLDSNEARMFSLVEMLAQVAAQRGTIEKIKDRHDEAEAGIPEPPPCDGAVKSCGFNLHASVRVGASDDRGRERLFRYCLRPPFSLDRLRVLDDGCIGYQVKKSGRRASRVRVMTPTECLARLCALIPPPYYPLTRFHGVVAPRSKLRSAIVPQPPCDVAASCCGKAKTSDARAEHADRAKVHDVQSSTDPPDDRVPTAHTPLGAHLLAQILSGRSEAVDANHVLSVKHWDRIGRGMPYAATSSVPWAILHARTFEHDVLECGHCGGRLRVRAVVVDPDVATKILASISSLATLADRGGSVARGPPLEQMAIVW